MPYTLSEKIKILEKAQKILTQCIEETQYTHQSTVENVEQHEENSPTLNIDYSYNNASEFLTDLKNIQPKPNGKKPRSTNNLVLKEGNLLFKAFHDFSKIDGGYQDYFEKEKINLVHWTETLRDIITTTKPSRKNPINKVVLLNDRRYEKLSA